jgi:hypothetical protein
VGAAGSATGVGVSGAVEADGATASEGGDAAGLAEAFVADALAVEPARARCEASTDPLERSLPRWSWPLLSCRSP